MKRPIRFDIVAKTIISMASGPPLGVISCGKSAWTKIAALGLNKAVKRPCLHMVSQHDLCVGV